MLPRHPAACVIVNVCPATVIVPVRAGPVFAVTAYATVPLPAPPVLPATEIHDALDETVHAQPAPAVTVTVPAAASAPIVREPGEMLKLHGAGGGAVGGGGAAAAPCAIATVWFATVTVADRALPSFAATVIVTVPGPFPFAAPLTCSHDAPLDAFHAQPDAVSTWIGTLPPSPPTAALAGETVNVHAAASWLIWICASLTVSVP
jgi:hypothetical protein